MKRVGVRIIAVVYALGWAATSSGAAFGGRVVDSDGKPLQGAVVYVIAGNVRLRIVDNEVLLGESVPRAITEADGRFEAPNIGEERCDLFVRDMEGRCALVTGAVPARSLEVKLPKMTRVQGALYRGPAPVAGEEVNAGLLLENTRLRYTAKTRTGPHGEFAFAALVPGKYVFQVIEEAPQVGCCFRSVVTKQAIIDLNPGDTAQLQLGGTDLPYLRGVIAEPDATPLYGVWVRLLPKINGEAACRTDAVVWSAVTEKDGSYAIYDIPPGDYEMRCFRRLGLNISSRTLMVSQDVRIPPTPEDAEPSARENKIDVRIDLAPFLPLEIGRPAPPVSATLLSGDTFDLSAQRGKMVVLYFHAGWCNVCRSVTPEIDELLDKFPSDKVAVVGVNLDESLEECRAYVAEKGIRAPQIYAGAWTNNPIVKDLRAPFIPYTVIIDTQGNVAQYGLFGDVLVNFIRKHMGAGESAGDVQASGTRP